MPPSAPRRLDPLAAIAAGALMLVVTITLAFSALLELLQGHVVGGVLLWGLSAVGILSMAVVFVLAAPSDRPD